MACFGEDKDRLTILVKQKESAIGLYNPQKMSVKAHLFSKDIRGNVHIKFIHFIKTFFSKILLDYIEDS